jgi:DNA-binding response OmpR family regulator
VVSKILIVDDDADMVEAGRLVLEREGHVVSSAPDYEGGIKAIEEVQPDLLILDVMMQEPDDGLRFARQVRRQGLSLPILMLTSVNVAMGLHIDKDAEILPVDEFQEKPIDPATLVQKVRQLLEQKEAPC